MVRLLVSRVTDSKDQPRTALPWRAGQEGLWDPSGYGERKLNNRNRVPATCQRCARNCTRVIFIHSPRALRGRRYLLSAAQETGSERFGNLPKLTGRDQLCQGLNLELFVLGAELPQILGWRMTLCPLLG